jgi:hypothetical protein
VFTLVTKNKTAAHGNHKILVRALHDHSALPLPDGLSDGMGDFGAPNSIGIIDHMKDLIFLCE